MAEETAIEKQESTAIQPERLRGGRSYVPHVDIIESDDELLLVADMPGVQSNEVDINYERGQLSISGKVAQRQNMEQTNFLLCEYGVGDFYRVFQIGEGIDAERIEADMHDGILTVHLPKAQALKPRKIAVKPA